MTQVNLSMKQKQTHRHRNRLVVAKGEGVGGMEWEVGVELADTSYYIWNG